MGDLVMHTPPPHVTSTLSAILRDTLSGGDEQITIGEIVDAFGPRAFGALLFVFAIPNLLPLPPGSSTFLSIPLLIIAPQLVIGVSTLWLPKVLDRRGVRRTDLARAFNKVLPRMEWVERLTAPRLGLVFGAVGDRLIGLVILLLTLVLILPIPFGNLLPAAAVAALALGLTQRDGVLVLVGYGIATASVIVLFLSAHAVVAAFNQVLRVVGGLT